VQLSSKRKSSSALQRATLDVLLLCTAANLSSRNKERLSCNLTKGIDWEYLLNQAHIHGIVPLVAYHLVKNGFCSIIPQPYLDHLNRIYNSTLYKNVILSSELAKVISAFKQRGIPVIPLKGTVLAEILCGNLALRHIEDIDILVHPIDVPRANSILVELGYKQLYKPPTWRHPFHEVPYYKRAKFSIYLELHHGLDDKTFVPISEQALWRRAQQFQTHGISTLVLSPEDNLLFLSTHLSRQVTELLKYIGDISELLKKYEVTLDWDYILTSACSWQIETITYYALARARYLLEAPVPASVLDTLRPAIWRRWLIGFLIDQNNLVKPIKRNKLTDWTMVLNRCLMIKHMRQMLAVLSRQQGSKRRWTWFRIAGWIVLVFLAGLGRRLKVYS
jgi:predicted CoA-binding protein